MEMTFISHCFKLQHTSITDTTLVFSKVVALGVVCTLTSKRVWNCPLHTQVLTENFNGCNASKIQLL